MRTTRLIAGTVSAALLGLTPIAIAAPSQAGPTWTTTTTATPDATALTYGDDLYVTVDVAGSDGLGPSSGTSTLYAMEAGSSTWVPVATGAYPGSDFYPVKPRVTTTYKVVFNGYTEPVQTEYSDNYTPSESVPFTVGVARKVTIGKAKARLTIKGKVKPDYKRSKVKVQIKKGKKYKKFKTVKTNKKSAFQVRLPAPRRGNKLYFKITVPGNEKFLAYSEVWYTSSYKAPLARSAAERA
ncbi:MAG TPA: hypothetical protein VLA70_06750 [Nocardioides sp.]|nr:hypothetical protein [Nocardioides sp.]